MYFVLLNLAAYLDLPCYFHCFFLNADFGVMQTFGPFFICYKTMFRCYCSVDLLDSNTLLSDTHIIFIPSMFFLTHTFYSLDPTLKKVLIALIRQYYYHFNNKNFNNVHL